MRCLLLMAFMLLVLSRSVLLPANQKEQIRAYTRSIEFDYVNWTLNALLSKNQSVSFQPGKYIAESSQQAIIDRYYAQVSAINQLRAQISRIYADPDITDPAQAAEDLLERLQDLEKENEQVGTLAESFLETQISQAIVGLELGYGGQILPPLLYHATPLPMALIISPRDKIQQIADISLLPQLTLDEIVTLENQVEENLNVSAIVVDIGGVGIYPTMVMRSTNLSWIIEVVAHEWIHNFLTLRPLGMLYYDSPQMRTINETTASLAGKEIALEVYSLFYPQFLPEPVEPAAPQPEPSSDPPIFDFRAQMHETRLTVDALLADGNIEEAERYMEDRRVVFWENGYQIRKINQAYFAFYGAYADVPGGVAGTDPVGPAVRDLRERSDSLAAFLKRIAWVTSFEGLQKAVREAGGS